MKKYYAYCRVSTDKQSNIRQEYLINEYCKTHNIEVYKWIEDIASGKSFNRKNYIAMKQELDNDSVLIISELDRLSRAYKAENNMGTIKEEWKELSDMGVRVVVCDMPLLSTDTDRQQTLDMTFIQNLVFEVLSYVANKEREKLSIRTKSGIAAKRANNPDFKIGRPTTITSDTIALIHSLREQGLSYDKISEETGVSKGSISRILNKGEK